MLLRIFCIIFVIVISTVSVCALDPVEMSAECAVVMDADTGRVLFEKNAHCAHSMASTTKIMTSLLAVESGRLNESFVVTDKMVNVEGTSMGLKAGDSVTLKDLVCGMLLSSGNDAANATAIYIGGTYNYFAFKMNERAKQIGMNDTNFVTPSGLDDKNHYSTAYDMALLGCAAVKNRIFLSVCSAQKVKLSFGEPAYERYLYNHNKLLGSYDGALGIKTGFTKKSGRCLVSFAKRNGVSLVAVTLNDPDDWNEHKRMLDYGFEQSKLKAFSVNIPETVNVVGGNADYVRLNAVSYNSTAQELEFKVYMHKFLYSPVSAGTEVGYVNVICDGKIIDVLPVTTAENA